jgi:hypothetical protein
MNWLRKHWRSQCALAALAATQRRDYETATKWLRRARWFAAPTNQ